MIVIVVIIIAAAWVMPEPPAASDDEFSMTTLFIYGYAMYLGFKHGYKPSDLLNREGGALGGGGGSMDGAPSLGDSEPLWNGSAPKDTDAGASPEAAPSSSRGSFGLYLCMFATMSSILLIVFFFRAQFIGLIVFMFSLGGSLSLSRVLQSLTYQAVPGIFEQTMTVSCLRQEKFRVASWAFSFLCIIIGISWFSYRAYTWSVVMHDLFSACICISVLHQLTVPNLRMMGVIYAIGIAYDVFWTFITPAIFGNSVMVQVATGESSTATCLDVGVELPLERTSNILKSLPFLLEMPRPCNDWTCAQSSVVGLGDVLIPGLMLVFCARIKFITLGTRKVLELSETERFTLANMYFLVSVVAYCTGLLLTYCSYVLMQGHGQPALMFILPSLYVMVGSTAYARGEFEILWNGVDKPTDTSARVAGANQELEPLEEGLLQEATPIL